MLEHLQVIAEKKGTARTFGALKREYDKSAPGVEKMKTRLIGARNKLAGTQVAEQIDAILHGGGGKMSIREEIEHLLGTWDDYKSLPTEMPLLKLGHVGSKEVAVVHDVCSDLAFHVGEALRNQRVFQAC